MLDSRNVCSSRLNPLSAIRRVEPFGWYFLSAGQFSVGSPTELLQPQELATFFQKLSSQFDWIVVDSPPVLPLSDAVALRQHLDGTLLVARAGSTPAKAVEDAIALLGRKHIIGLSLMALRSFNIHIRHIRKINETRDQPRQLKTHQTMRRRSDPGTIFMDSAQRLLPGLNRRFSTSLLSTAVVT